MSMHSIDTSAMLTKPSASSIRRLFVSLVILACLGVYLSILLFCSQSCVDSITVRVRAHA